MEDEEKIITEATNKLNEINNQISEAMRVYNSAPKMKEVVFEMDTGDLGRASFITKKIKGKIEALIVSSTGPINMVITLADFSSIELFNTHNIYINGERYLPLRLSPLDVNGEKFNFGQAQWCVSDKLRFECDGPYNTKIKVMVRYY